ncbi:MAG: glycosyltransferase family 2 protein [Chlamydiales bacterium]|nr:glycosyltransferase family 2 protein [Chlamydiales bacterium]
MWAKKIRYVLGVFILLVAAAAVWQGARFFKTEKKVSSRSKSSLVLEEKPFVIVIPSYKNSSFCEKNLRSVFEQKYKNYRVIYIDDCSPDDTFAKAKDLVEKSGQQERFTLIRNEKNRGALSNFYHAIHTCRDNEIIVALDGDDFLAHDEVLVKLNRIYSKGDVWMTYGNYLDYPTYKQSVVSCKKIPDKVVKQNSFRKAPWVSSHLRTFYAGLFKQIKYDDLLYQGNFYPMAGDLAMMFPLLEMSGRHAQFVSDILYLYNRTNPLNDHKVNFALQEQCANAIRASLPYQPLKSLPGSL